MGCQTRAGRHSSIWLEAKGLLAAFGDSSTPVGQECGRNILCQMGFLVTDLVFWHGRSSRLLLLRQISD